MSAELDYQYIYYANRGRSIPIFFSALVFATISFFVKSGHALFLYGAAALCILIGLSVALDHRVLLAFDLRGVYINGQHFKSAEITGFSITEKQDGIARRYYFNIQVLRGSEHRVDLARLNRPADEVIRELASVFEKGEDNSSDSI